MSKNVTVFESVVSLKTVVMFVTWMISRKKFLVWNLFYNNIFLLTSLFEVEMARERCRFVCLIQVHLN